MDQSGRVVYGDDAPMPADRILSMNWLLTSVEGRIPQFEELQKKLRSSSSSRVWSGRASHEDLSYF